jgi:hypothetical protein
MSLQVIGDTKNTSYNTVIKKCELVMRRCVQLFRDPQVEKHWSMSVLSGTDIIRSPQVFGFSDILLAHFIQGYEGERGNATILYFVDTRFEH